MLWRWVVNLGQPVFASVNERKRNKGDMREKGWTDSKELSEMLVRGHGPKVKRDATSRQAAQGITEASCPKKEHEFKGGSIKDSPKREGINQGNRNQLHWRINTGRFVSPWFGKQSSWGIVQSHSSSPRGCASGLPYMAVSALQLRGLEKNHSWFTPGSLQSESGASCRL